MSKAIKSENQEDAKVFETLTVHREGGVLFAKIAAPPMNLLGPELVRDLVSFIHRAEADDTCQVLVFKSADPDYFISHVDVTRIKQIREEAAKLEVMLSAEDYDADLAERYGWINRALPANRLDEFVRSLAHRIANFPAAGHVVVKDRVNAVGLPPIEDFRRDSELFIEGFRNPEAQSRIQTAMKRGFQTRDAEMALARTLGDLADHGSEAAWKK